MKHVILGVTGSVAAMRTPELARALAAEERSVRVVATESSTYFFRPEELPTNPEHVSTLYRDSDEWPPPGYSRGDTVLHIALRDWADLLVVAPLDAHTLAKFALGLSDNLLSCIFRAWDFRKTVILAPAMNTLMWESPVTLRHLRLLFEDRAGRAWAPSWTLEDAPEAFATHTPGIILVPPLCKRLACGDVGIGAMEEVAAIAEVVRAWTEAAPG